MNQENKNMTAAASEAMPEFKSICHVNLARGFRGGERQTTLLIRHLQLLYPDLKQFLVCRKNSEIPAYVKDIPNLAVIEVRNECFGHVTLGTQAEIIHAHEAKAVHFAAIHHRIYGTPYIITRRVPQRVKNTFFNRYSFDHASFISSVSNAIRSSIIESFGSSLNLSGKLRVIYSVFNSSRGNPEVTAKIRSELNGSPVFGHIGAYVDKHKGQKVFIEAIRKLVKDRPDAVFIFLGAGCDEEELRKMTENLPQVKWLGFKTNVADYIDAMDYFVFPSRNEGLGSVLLDVIDHGVPVIASEVDGIPEIIQHEKTGLLFDNGNTEMLYQEITRLLNDNNLRDRLVDNATESLKKFSPETCALKYAELYTAIIEKVNHSHDR